MSDRMTYLSHACMVFLAAAIIIGISAHHDPAIQTSWAEQKTVYVHTTDNMNNAGTQDIGGHGVQVAFGHSMFNSAEEFMAGYRVQVATAPEFPQIDEPSMFLVRVTDVEFQEVDRFTMGIRFFFNGQQIDAVPPTPVEGGHWDFTHVWHYQGNHIVKVDLYDMPDKPGVTTYTFNMGTQSPFGYIFIISITVGAFCFAGVMSYIYMPRLLRGKKKRSGGKGYAFGR